MNEEIEKRRNLKFTEIEKLSQPLPIPKTNDLIKGQIYFTNHRMDYILKTYANWEYDCPIHATFEHGILFTNYIGHTFECHGYLPSIVASNYRKDVLKKEINYSGAYAIGPYIHYTNSLLDDNQINEEKERLGKTLLVFPSHSTNKISVTSDFENFSNEIKDISKDYDSVRICMYYSDVNLGRHKLYERQGFEVVSAGHYMDCNFLPRLKSIIKTSDMTMSNDIGSHLGYCIYLNKPHYLSQFNNLEFNFDKADDTLINEIQNVLKVKNSSDNVAKIKNLFSEYDTKISKEQKEFIGYLWGFDEVKTRDELNDLFLEINNNFSWLKYYLVAISRTEDIRGALNHYFPNIF